MVLWGLRGHTAFSFPVVLILPRTKQDQNYTFTEVQPCIPTMQFLQKEVCPTLASYLSGI